MPDDKLPLWRRKLAERPPMAAWWLRRHHCSDVVIGQPMSQGVDKPRDTDTQSQDIDPLRQERPR